MIAFSFIAGTVVVFLIYFIWNKSSLSSLPGPPALPFIGNVFEIDKDRPFISFDRLANQYGGIFKLKLLNRYCVAINNFEYIYQVLVKKSSDFDGRPHSFKLDFIGKDSDVVLQDSGPKHKGRRKVLQSFLKQFGSGIQRIEELTINASTELIDKLSDTQGKPIDIKNSISECFLQLIVILLIGDRVDPKDAKNIYHAVDQVSQGLIDNLDGTLLDSFPFLRYFGNKTFKQIRNTDYPLKQNYISNWLKQKPEVGFVNHLLSMSTEKQQESYVEEYDAKLGVIFDFLAAGIFTSSTTLTCLTNVLCFYPEVQKKLQDEAEKQIGRSRAPTMNDRNNMPYHRATLLEIGRFASIVPLGLPHTAKLDTFIGDYPIPKDTVILTNLWSLHHDEEFWNKPFEFKPERYLDENGDLVAVDHPNRKHTMPFGAGNRVCVGEIFAQSRLFLFLAQLMQHFTVQPETTIDKQPSCDPREMISGIVNVAPDYKVRFNML